MGIESISRKMSFGATGRSLRSFTVPSLPTGMTAKSSKSFRSCCSSVGQPGSATAWWAAIRSSTLFIYAGPAAFLLGAFIAWLGLMIVLDQEARSKQRRKERAFRQSKLR